MDKAYDHTPRKPEKDALSISWDASNIYMNPPYSKAKVFVAKLLDEMDRNNRINSK